jgi:NADP-dependent 3-hydroxy acid dehydrogenase YdfG
MLDLGLTDKIAIVTGGSEGLGRATAMRLAAEGCRVVICARRKDVLERAAEDIRKLTWASGARPGRRRHPPRGRGGGGERDARGLRGVDILVNNAGTSSAGPFEKVDDATWRPTSRSS